MLQMLGLNFIDIDLMIVTDVSLFILLISWLCCEIFDQNAVVRKKLLNKLIRLNKAQPNLANC